MLRVNSFPLRRASRESQRGQALTEFLVLSVALIPIFLLMPMIAKYQDISHASQMASRYVAFETTTRNDVQGVSGYKSSTQLADEVRRRFYGNSDAAIKTDDTAGDFDANRNLFWRDPYGKPLIAAFNDVAVSFGNGGSSHNAAFSPANDSSPFNLPLVNAQNMGLKAQGIYTANVSVKIANLPSGISSVEPFDKINLSVQRHTSLLFDPWSASDPAQTETRSGRMAPLDSALAAIQPVLAVAMLPVDLGRIDPPKFGNLAAWRDVVPADRLVAP